VASILLWLDFYLLPARCFAQRFFCAAEILPWLQLTGALRRVAGSPRRSDQSTLANLTKPEPNFKNVRAGWRTYASWARSTSIAAARLWARCCIR